MPEFTAQDAEAEHALNPVQIDLPTGIKWDPAVVAVIDQHETAYGEWDAAWVELDDARREYEDARQSDEAKLRKAALDGKRDPGDDATRAAFRKLHMATERCRQLRLKADRAADISRLNHLIKQGAPGYIWQALDYIDLYADVYVKTLARVREEYGAAAHNLQAAYNLLGFFSDMQGQIKFSVPGNVAGDARFPNGGPHLSNAQQFREMFELHMPAIEKRIPTAYADLAEEI